MTAIKFSCEATLDLPPEAIAGQILELDRWPEFQGYGVLPGIRKAEFETRTPCVVGTRIRVTSRDGSTHTEEILSWEPERRVQLRMTDFTPPLSWLATEFLETWEFKGENGRTVVVRSFELHPRSRLTSPPLRLIAGLLRRAVERHLRQIDAVPEPETTGELS